MELASTAATWPFFTTASGSEHGEAQSSIALDFLVGIATAGVRIYSSPAALGIDGKLQNLTVGRGGSFLVQKGETGNGKVVAVKQAVPSTTGLRRNDRDGFESYLHRVCLELRILTHGQIKTHVNIVDLVGLCWAEHSGRPYLGLVLEFSPYGTLKTFLQDHIHLSDTALTSLAAQVAAGLEVLHKHKICHGDVKTLNALVFQTEDEEPIRVKISDFSEALIDTGSTSARRVECRWGTRLLNAPEIRTGAAARDETYGIDAAILTDVYSFGLLLWETLKHGQSYFDKHWFATDTRNMNVDSMEELLESLPCNGLLDKASQFARQRLVDTAMIDCILQVFHGSIQDDPQRRISMTEIRTMLENAKKVDE
jgi:serine/threonine protein kinase